MRMLRQAVVALAMPGHAALETLDPRCARPDELAIDFGEPYLVILGSFTSEMTPSQLSSLQQLDAHLEAMSGAENSHLWTEEAVVSSQSWREVRVLASAVLREFGWSAV